MYKKFLNKPQNKKNKVGGIYGLYMYYCYLLNVYPQEHPTKRISPAIRADVRKMDMLAEEARMLSSKKIKTYKELNEYKIYLENNMNDLKEKREIINLRSRKIESKEEKENLQQTILELNMEISSLRKEIGLCKDIEERLPVMVEKIKDIDDDIPNDIISISKQKEKIEKKEDEKIEYIK